MSVETQHRGAETSAMAEPKASKSRAFRPDVQGLRAIAVGLVVVYHAGVHGIPGGYVGVDVFFVISGYLITGLLFREAERSGRISIVDFYARRARRILPISSLALIATVFASNHYLGYVRGQTIATDARWAMGFMANIHFALLNTDYLNAQIPPSPVQHYWSLAVEEQFYVLWPVLFLAVVVLARHSYQRALRVVLLLAVVASFIWSIRQTTTDANWSYFSPLTRSWELGAGALLALWEPHIKERLNAFAGSVLCLGGLTAVAYAAVAYDSTTRFPGYAAALPVLGAVAILAAGTVAPLGWYVAALGWFPLKWIGDISYSLYLWHWPILIIAAQHAGHALSLLQNLGLVALAVLISAATYYLVENPFRRARSLQSRRGYSLAAGAAMVLAVSLTANMVNALEPAGTSAVGEPATATGSLSVSATPAEVAAAVLGGTLLQAVPATLRDSLSSVARDRSPAYDDGCLIPSSAFVSPSCTFGDLAGSEVVVLFGDSHAAQWMPPLTRLASANHLRLVVLTKSNCPVAKMSLINTVSKTPFTACDKWRTNALSRISALKPRLVVAASTLRGIELATPENSTRAKDAAYQTGLTSTLGILNSASKRVVVLGDVPQHAQVPASCLSIHLTNLQACDDAEATSTLAAFQAHEQATTKAAKAEYVDVLRWFCANDRCPSLISGSVTAFDQAHLTAAYSSYLSGVLGQAIGLSTESAVAPVEQAVQSAALIKLLPADLTPALGRLSGDQGTAGSCLRYRTQDTRLGELGPNTSDAAKTCVFGDKAGTKTLVLYGDSHAAMWLPAFDLMGRRDHWRVILLSQAACPASDVRVWDTIGRAPYINCDKFRISALAQINDIKPALVVLTSSFFGVRNTHNEPVTTTQWQAGTTATIQGLKASNRRVVILGDTPYLNSTAPDCLAANTAAVQTCSTAAGVAEQPSHLAAERGAAALTATSYVDVSPWFCSSICTAVIGNIGVYFNRFHVSATYVTYLNVVLAQAVGIEK